MDLGFLGKFLNTNYIGRILPAKKNRVTYRVTLGWPLSTTVIVKEQKTSRYTV